VRRLAAAAVAVGVLLGATACSDGASNPDYARICVDAQTHQRVPGNECGSNDGSALDGFLWGYVLFGSRMPAYGTSITNVTHVTYHVPKSAVVEHDEKLLPQGGKGYTKSTATRTYSTGGGKTIGSFKGTSGFKSSGGYKAPAPKAPAVKAPSGGGGYKAPAVKAPSSGGFKSGGFSSGGGFKSGPKR
jgi:hypothetical protein